MKKTFKILIIAALLVMAMCAVAFAADPAVEGVYNVTTSGSGITISFFYNAEGEAITSSPATVSGASVEFYEKANSAKVSAPTTDQEAYYMVMLLADGELPNKNNIFYINQKTAGGTTPVEFTIYPKDLVAGKKYNVMISTNADGGSIKNIASFEYYTPIARGDADMSGKVDVDDALVVLKHVAEIERITNPLALSAADVDGITGVDVADALRILQYVASIITEL